MTFSFHFFVAFSNRVCPRSITFFLVAGWRFLHCRLLVCETEFPTLLFNRLWTAIAVCVMTINLTNRTSKRTKLKRHAVNIFLFVGFAEICKRIDQRQFLRSSMRIRDETEAQGSLAERKRNVLRTFTVESKGPPYLLPPPPSSCCMASAVAWFPPASFFAVRAARLSITVMTRPDRLSWTRT